MLSWEGCKEVPSTGTERLTWGRVEGAETSLGETRLRGLSKGLGFDSEFDGEPFERFE